jgi:hypothetical protein
VAVVALAAALMVGLIGLLAWAAVARSPDTTGGVGRLLFACVRHADHAAGNHGAHLAILVGAVVVYAGYVSVGIVRNGWPSFSWRLRPPD